MRLSRAALLPLAVLASTQTLAQTTQIWPNGSRPSARGPDANFTGSVRIDPLFPPNEHITANGGVVTFEPGARSFWHSHPAGQTLIVTSGTGWVQERDGAKREIKPGDVIWTPPVVDHWHGATATNGMSHIALTGTVGGRTVEWKEKVPDEQYGR